MKRTLLIPTDFDVYAPRLMDFAAGTRDRGIVRCILVHVLSTQGVEAPVMEAAVEEATHKLGILAKPIEQAGISVEIRILTGAGAPGPQVRELAVAEKVDVIVIGSTAKSRLSRFFTGSMSEDVAYGQTAPTLMLRDDIIASAADAEALSLDWSRKLVVPVDYSASSARAVLQCTRFEPDAVGEVRLVHVLTSCPRGRTMDECVIENEFRLSAFGKMLEDVGLTVSVAVLQGPIVETILKEVVHCGATGIVSGTRDRGKLTELVIGSNSLDMVRDATVPVMVVP